MLIGVDATNAAIVTGTPRADRLRGTSGADFLYGRAGSDRITAGAGPDFIHGGPGRDIVLAGPGDDRIALQVDRARDSVNCGRGHDIVNAERTDLVAADCEIVARQISRDPYRTGLGQHETQVEPDSMSAGRTIVTAFQTGRFTGGGAANIGWSTSRDGGQTWISGFLPGTTIFSALGGTLDLVTDPVVAYDAAHRTWLIASLGVSPAGTVLLVSRSADGRRWSLPVRAVVGAPVEELDKEWLACDNWASSRFRGRCYLSYLSFGTGQLRTARSNDGGRTWSTPVVMYGRIPGHLPNGVQPVARPDGSVIVSFEVFTLNSDGNHIGAVRSVDGGQTLGAGDARRLDRGVTGDGHARRAPALDGRRCARQRVRGLERLSLLGPLRQRCRTSGVARRRQLVCADPGPDRHDRGCGAPLRPRAGGRSG